MTGGTVAVLGKTGRNFGAGMSGGLAYVYDEDGQFAQRCNTAMVSMDKVLTAAEQEAQLERKFWHNDQTDEAQLKKLLEEHFKWTGSRRARELLKRAKAVVADDPQTAARLVDQVDQLAKSLAKDKVIYVHCQAGGRCKKAADILAKAGYDVRALKPGFPDLAKAGFPTAKNADCIATTR